MMADTKPPHDAVDAGLKMPEAVKTALRRPSSPRRPPPDAVDAGPEAAAAQRTAARAALRQALMVCMPEAVKTALGRRGVGTSGGRPP